MQAANPLTLDPSPRALQGSGCTGTGKGQGEGCLNFRNALYAIQGSTNLAVWETVTNVTINTNGLATFSDPAATNFSRRFYQALLAAP